MSRKTAPRRARLFLALSVLVSLLTGGLFGYVVAQGGGTHSASEVSAGVFGPGNFQFPDSLGVGANPIAKLDVADRMIVRQGTPPNSGNTAGIWFYHPSATPPERGFVGMVDNNRIGIYGHQGAGWGLLMDTATGYVFIGPGAQNPGQRLQVDGNVLVTGEVIAAKTTYPQDGGPEFPRLSTEVAGTALDVIGAGAWPDRRVSIWDTARIESQLLFNLRGSGDCPATFGPTCAFITTESNRYSLQIMGIRDQPGGDRRVEIFDRLEVPTGKAFVGGSAVCRQDGGGCQPGLVRRRNGNDLCGGTAFDCATGCTSPSCTITHYVPRWTGSIWDNGVGTPCNWVLCTQ